MADTKIFITDCDHANINEEKAVFDKAGIAYKLVQCKTEDDVIANCQGAVAVCNQYAPLTDKVFSAIPTLKTVVRYGVGVDNVDLKQHGTVADSDRIGNYRHAYYCGCLDIHSMVVRACSLRLRRAYRQQHKVGKAP